VVKEMSANSKHGVRLVPALLVGLAVVGAFDGGTVGGLVLGLLVGAPLVTKQRCISSD
jgi:hypothetical protein